jgi:hypothetical protein
MHRVIVATVALFTALSPAHAQFSGQIPNNTVLGNTSGANAPARPVPLGSGSGALGANPTAQIGAAAVNGSANTFLRSDGAPALADSGVAAGTYTLSTVTFDAKGRATSASNGSVVSSQRVTLGWDPNIDPNNNVIATFDQASTVASIVGTVHVAVGATATLDVYVAASGTACSGGTKVNDSTPFNANGTANTNQTLTLSNTAIASGSRLCVITSNSANWLAGLGIGGVTVRVTTP